jgi:hypothetical protein
MSIFKTIGIEPSMCECGRLYKDRKDEHGKMICSACYTKLEVKDLKRLWSTPIYTLQGELE